MLREMLSTDLRLLIAQKCVCQASRNRWGSYRLPQTPSRYKGERKEMVGNRDAEEGEGVCGRGESVGKGEGKLKLDICPWAPLVRSDATAHMTVLRV